MIASIDTPTVTTWTLESEGLSEILAPTWQLWELNLSMLIGHLRVILWIQEGHTK